MTDDTDRADYAPRDDCATLDLPLRGLASDGADARVGPPLRALSGVVAVDVIAAAFRVRVTYDPTRVTPETIRETLHGLVPPDTAHGAVRRDPPGAPTADAAGGAE